MKSPPAPSIQRRVISANLVSALVGALLVASAVWWVVGDEVDELMDHSLSESAEIIHNVLLRHGALDHAGQAAPDGGEYEADLVWQVVDPVGGKVLNRSHRAPSQPLLTALLPHGQSAAHGPWHVVTLGFKGESRFLLVAQSEAERSEARFEVMSYTAAAAVLMVLLSAGLMNWALRRELRPIDQLTRSVQGYDPLQPSSFAEDVERAELVPVQQAVEELGRRLAQRMISERAFTHHAAHALRTPLAGIEAQLAAALLEAPEELRPRLERARQSALRLGRVMQALMMMFRSGIEPRRETASLGDLLRPDLFPGLDIRIGKDAALQADPDLMTAVLLNLLDNAQRHRATRVDLDVQAQADGWRVLRVRDDGQGTDDERRTRMNNALARQDYNPRAGLSGLGLILADLVLRAHGGRVELPATTRGFEVCLTWPDHTSVTNGFN